MKMFAKGRPRKLILSELIAAGIVCVTTVCTLIVLCRPFRPSPIHPRFDISFLSGAKAAIQLQIPPWVISQEPARSPPGASLEALQRTSKSQRGEDLHFVRTYWRNPEQPGFYVELGALDGVEFSNTLALSTVMGWRGLLIEPGERYRDLQKNRPNDTLVNAAVCATPRTVHFVEGGAVGGILEFMSADFKLKWHPSSPKGIPLNCLRLGDVLSAFSFRRVDFLVVDTEGGELEVLQSVDFSRVCVGVVCVEADGTNPQKDRAVQELLLHAGFAWDGFVDGNDWFQRRIPCS